MHAKVTPVWAPELAQLSGLQHHHFLNIEQKILDAFDAAVPSGSQLSQSTFSNPLQTSSLRGRNQNEYSDVFKKEEMERMLGKSKVLSAQKA